MSAPAAASLWISATDAADAVVADGHLASLTA
jgi:hypothetical protein